jgi:hypothetical protein
MRKIILPVILIFMLAGCDKEKRLTDTQIARMPNPQTTGLPLPTGGMVLAVDNETITCDQVIGSLAEPLRQQALNPSFETFKRESRPLVEQFVAAKIANIIVYKNAKRDAGTQAEERINEAVETEVKRFLANFGGDYASAEDALKKDGFNTWQEFRDFQKKLILSQSYLSAKLPPEQPITYNEMLAFYNRVKANDYTKAGRISFQLIDIQPAKLDNPYPNKPVIQTARELADSLLLKIKSGEDFANLARQYSKGPWADTGGIFEPVEPNSLAKPYDILAKQAQNLAPGQIAGPIEIESHIFIMKLLDKQNETNAPFEKVQDEIKKRIQLDRRKKFFDELNEKIVQQASIENKDDFVDFCLLKIYEKNNKQVSYSQ